MRILFDHDIPRPLRRYLPEHAVDTAAERGWAELRNGILLDSAEREGYEIMITADQSMPYQQNLGRRQIAIIVLLANRWSDVQMRVEDIRAALDWDTAGRIAGSSYLSAGRDCAGLPAVCVLCRRQPGVTPMKNQRK